jgi:sphingomyelin phosphodiesterase acid-like 3
MFQIDFDRARLHGLIAGLAAGLLGLAACSDTEGAASVAASANTGFAAQETPSGTADRAETGAMALPDEAAPAAPALPLPTAGSAGSFLALSDVHLQPSPPTCVGSDCQSTPTFWDATQTRARALVTGSAPDFVIYLGDMPAHGMSDPASRNTVLGHVLGGLANLVEGSSVPLLYLPGNNDTLGFNPYHHGSYQYDYCPFTEGTGTDARTVFNADTDPSDTWPILNAAGAMLDGSHLADGYYAARLGVGSHGAHMRVLALNTNVYTSLYTHCSTSAAETGSTQLDWMLAQLADAAAASEPVLLAMHVPPGDDGYGGDPMWDPDLAYQGQDASLAGRSMQQVFLDFVSRHTSTITTVISGHTHLNGVRRLHACDTAQTFTELLVSVPGISADHGNNPGFKLFTLGAGLEPVDVATYGAVLPASSGSDFTWTGETVVRFRDNYPNSTPAGSSLFDQAGSLGDDALWTGMWAYLYVRQRMIPAGQVPQQPFYRQAMDAHCTP